MEMITAPQDNVLSELHSLLVTHLPPCLDNLLASTVQALQEQCVRANNNREERVIIDFIQHCQQMHEQLGDASVRAIEQRFSNNAPPLTPPLDAEEWHLVDNTEVDELLEMRRLVRQLRLTLGTVEWRNCARFNRINATPRSDAENPLSLEFLVRTLQSLLQLRQQSLQIRESVYATWATVLSAQLPDLYNQIDRLFEQLQIVPLAEPSSVSNRQRTQGAPHKAVGAESRVPYQAIQQLRAVEHNRSTNPAVPLATDRQAVQQAISTLQVPAHQGWSVHSFMQQLQQTGVQLSARQYDDAGLVAELFQHLEQQAVIATGVKPALRRLMPAVAQAAILDPAAFADPAHPVRATLDKLMHLCDFSEPTNPALEQRIEQLIDGIVKDYRGDPEVFSRCDQQLEQLLAVQEKAYRNNADRVMQFHRGRDKLELARAHVSRELALLFDGQAPKILIDWLDSGWRELLVHELLRQGEQGSEWKEGFSIIRQLNGWLQADTDTSTDHVERDYEAEQVVELLRKRTESLLPGQYRHLPLLKQLLLQLRREQPIERVTVEGVTATKPLPNYFEPSKQRWHERVQQLATGDWLLTDTGQHLQLIWANPNTGHYVLANRQGHEVGTFTAQQLIEHLANGWIGAPAPDAQGVIQDHLEAIVGKLYRDIAHVRSHDELTGLLNRRSFEAAVAQTLASTDNYAFIYAHIDQFSLLNSSCGHLAGDSYLKQVAALLRKQMPESATVARIGGADFAVALAKTDGGRAFQLAEALRSTIEANAFDWQGNSHGITMSLGMVLTSDRHDVVNVFCDLQMACNAAKESGRNRVHIYEEQTDGAGAGLMAIAGRVDGIVERGELSLRLQKIAPAPFEHNELPHYEVLLVMQNDLSLLDFISAAERYNRMTKVDRWVLKSIFSHLAQHPNFWNISGGVSINLSGSSLNDDKLLGFIEALFDQYQLPAEKICFELTETTAVANLTKTADFVRHLQKFGCTFSIDDFGTGFSSFEYLKRLPVDFVKIDGGFVKEIERSPSDLAMVRSINEIAHVLGRKTIAEYVETVSIREQLVAMGVDYVQGYAVERPKPLSELLALC
ncbi:MAG: diguanylate cyclase (GGDEF)-like protein [Pseudomonas sp.]|jgi:diguanylate cyclase (GGDEF)-like protein